jgi:hypothetical protein
MQNKELSLQKAENGVCKRQEARFIGKQIFLLGGEENVNENQ